MKIGERIAFLRKQQNMTQEQLARHLGTSRQAVSKWEAGKSIPDIDYVIRLGELFQVSMDYLLLGKEETAMSIEKTEPCQLNMDGKGNKPYRILFAVLLVLGVIVLLLLPLIASVYQNYAWGPRYTDANQYLKEWPLCGVVIIGVLAAVIGIGGIIWTFKEKIWERITKEIT